MDSGGVARKVRSDKKLDVKATMSVKLKDQLYTLCQLCGYPVKEISERLCVNGMTSRIIMSDFAKWMQRDYTYHRTVVLGNSDRPHLKIMPRGETGTVSIRFMLDDYKRLRDLAYSLDISISATATSLIRVTTLNEDFMNDFIKQLELDSARLIRVKSFINTTWGGMQ